MNTDRPNSKIITIFRAGAFLERAQGKDATEYFGLGRVGVGSYYEKQDSRRIATGLTRREEELLLPDYIDADAGERQFREKVSAFYRDINTNIPYETGLRLEIGLTENNDAAVSKDNMPYDVMDYLRYKHAKGHPFMAQSKEEADSNAMKQYYIFDPSQVQTKNKKKNEALDAAMQIYLKLKDDEDQVAQMLRLLGVEPREFTGPNAPDLRIEALRKQAETNTKSFNEIYTTGDVVTRALVRAMQDTGILVVYGTKYYDGETKKLLTNSAEEMYAFFNDEDSNSDAITTYKARLQEALKKPYVAKKKTTPLPAGVRKEI